MLLSKSAHYGPKIHNIKGYINEPIVMHSRNTEHFIPAQIQTSDCFGYDRGSGKQKCK